KDIQAPKRPNGVVDELVQDPVCHTYIPRSTAYALKLGGKEYFFCGKECAQKFQKEVKEAKREE
ncbi:MAG: YHS domain-containing protein, partial [Desulfatiglandales bacterium]